jgi:anti-sigma factor RsiW
MEILVSAYIDDEVTEEERHTVEHHLQQCADCRATVTSFSRIQTLYQQLEVKEAPRDFRQQVAQRLDEQSRSLFPWRMPRLVYALSCVLILLLGGLMATLSPWWLNTSPQIDTVAQAVEVYAEDVLFGESVFAVESLFAAEDTDSTGYVDFTEEEVSLTEDSDFVENSSIAEDILNSLDFSEGDMSFLNRGSGGTKWLS